MVVLIIFLLTYIISVSILLFITYKLDTDIKTIGDLLDESKLFMYIPFMNTVASFIALVVFPILYLNYRFGIISKFKNIKIRK